MMKTIVQPSTFYQAVATSVYLKNERGWLEPQPVAGKKRRLFSE